MLDLVVMMLAQGFPALTTVYWICLIVGGGLLIVGALAGGDHDVGVDTDVGVDVGADVDVDLGADVVADVDAGVDADVHTGHGHAGSLAGWFSMQFIVFFLAMFGLVGVTFSYLTDTTTGLTFICALAGGLAVGQGVHQILRKLRSTSGDSTPKPQDYVDKPARVTIRVTSAEKGEVALHVGRAERFIPALSKRADQTFKPGDQVAVVGYHGGVAEIVSREEYEFLTEKN